MRAAVIMQWNQPWQLQTLADPKPGAGQVVIRVRACGMCGTDMHVHHGHFGWLQPPLVAGHEPVGEAAQVGPGVTHLKVGDRVGVHWVQSGCGRWPSGTERGGACSPNTPTITGRGRRMRC